MRRRQIGVGAAAVFAVLGGAQAQNTVFVGHDLQGQITEHTKAGALLGTWGLGGNVGPAVGDGIVYSTQPSGAQSVITKQDCITTNVVGSMTFNGTYDPGNTGLPGWIEDLSYGGGGTLWVGAYNGVVSHIDGSGNILSQFYTGTTYTGVTTDGVVLYTTRGFYGTAVIDIWTFTGTPLGSIPTGIQMGGLGWDSETGHFFAGDVSGNVHEITATGTPIGSWNAGSGAVDGLEVGSCIPAPAAMSLLGVAGLTALRRRRG